MFCVGWAAANQFYLILFQQSDSADFYPATTLTHCLHRKLPSCLHFICQAKVRLSKHCPTSLLAFFLIYIDPEINQSMSVPFAAQSLNLTNPETAALSNGRLLFQSISASQTQITPVTRQLYSMFRSLPNLLSRNDLCIPPVSHCLIYIHSYIFLSLVMQDFRCASSGSLPLSAQ